MLNSVTLMGRMTADPELRVATTGKEICRFRLAVDRPGGDRVADFIPIICFGSTANFVEKYFRKGSMIALQGKLQTGSYTGNDGKKRSTFEVVAGEVSFCGERTPQSQPAAATAPLSGAQNKASADNEGTGYFSTAVPGDFDEIVGDEEYE